MIILTHVIIALLSMVSTSVGFVRPTQNNLRASYVLAALTFATGTFMVLTQSVQILHACLSGVAYLAVVIAGIVLTRRKLALMQSAQEA